MATTARIRAYATIVFRSACVRVPKRLPAPVREDADGTVLREWAKRSCGVASAASVVARPLETATRLGLRPRATRLLRSGRISQVSTNFACREATRVLNTKGESHEQEDSWIHESEVGLLLVRRLRGNRRWRARWRFRSHPVGGKRKVGRGREKVGCPERQSR